MKTLSLYMCVALAALVALAGCVRDNVAPVDPTGDDDGTRQMLLHVVMPDSASPSSGTRSISATEENTIETVDVLAFKIDGANETFDYAVKATLAAGSAAGATTQTFTANLRMQSYQQRFVLITNASTQVSALVAATAQGTAKATMLAGLKYNLASGADRWTANSASDYLKMPMWGESASETVASTTKTLTSTVYLMRMVARLDVAVESGAQGRFKLRSVALYNVNNGGNIVPDATKTTTEQRSGATYVRVTAPTIPVELQPYSARRVGPVTYTDFSAPGVADVAMTGAIYLFEAAAVASPDAQATCLVVGGVYTNSAGVADTNPTYYRVELFATGTQTRLDIMRNHQYVVHITDVQGRGYATAAEAFNSKAVNMTAQVLQWSNPGMDNIVFNGQYYLATDKATVNLFANEYTGALATGGNVVQAITDVPGGWTQGTTTNGDGTGTAAWVRISPTTGAAGTTTRITISVDANNTGAERVAIVNLVAGRLRLPIRVVQSVQPAIALNILNQQGGTEIQELVFNSTPGQTPTTQSFVVNWLPASNPVSVAATSVAQYEFPNPGGNPAVSDGAPYQNMPWDSTTGSKSFSVSPPQITAAEFAANPFIRKSSRFDMTVNNGYTTLTKSITLTQLYYNLLVEGRSDYNVFTAPFSPMDGARYSYNVRSNATFKISNIVENPRVAGAKLIANPTGLDNVYINATGGPVSTPGGGWREYYTTNNAARGMSGYADVTYSPDKTTMPFTPVTRRLFFPAAHFNIFSICLMNSNSPSASNYSWWSGSGPNQPPSSDHDVHTMTNLAASYGTTTTGNGTSDTFTSTVPVNGIGTYGLWVGGGTSASTDGNTYSGTTVTVAMINAAVAANADMLVISGDSKIPWDQGDGNAAAKAIYDNFLAKDKPVLLCLEDLTSVYGVWVAAMNAGKAAGGINSTQIQTNAGPTYRLLNVEDPILQGPFRHPDIASSGVTQSDSGSMQGVCWGADGSGITYFWPDNANDMIAYSNANDQNNTSPGTNLTDRYTMFRMRNTPLVVVGDGGFLSSWTQDSKTNYPTIVNTSTKKPDRKSYGGTYARWTYNAGLIANTMAWAIQRRTTQ